MRAGIALGSNLGDRSALLLDAIAHLKAIHEGGTFLASTLHETDPVDCPPGSPCFLNGVVELETSLHPVALLAKLQNLEHSSGRARQHERNAPRTLDLDLLYCDEMTLHHDALELPHPRITERPFVLAPLTEIRPDLRLPGWSMTCAEYLSQIHNK
jgi:2-amino-4-hydroxy-6-hydroxymethyldihydropteridine diphosphokinase